MAPARPRGAWGGAPQRPAGTPHTPEQTFATVGEAPRTPLPLQLHPPLALAPDPLTAHSMQAGRKTTPRRGGEEGKARNWEEKGKGAVSPLSLSLFTAPPAQASK